jgi:hypothetical protein
LTIKSKYANDAKSDRNRSGLARGQLGGFCALAMDGSFVEERFFIACARIPGALGTVLCPRLRYGFRFAARRRYTFGL